jgi:uncharacterized protein YbjT (DUF2867 family)
VTIEKHEPIDSGGSVAKKIIAITGATGGQGGGLARAILNDSKGDFAARAITRNPDSDNAKALAAAGAEVVRADLDDVESLERAFQGAHGAYCVTNYWEHFSPAKETQQGRNLAQAARAAGVRHAIWSTFEDTRDYVPLNDDRMPTLMEHYKVPHFDAKAEANEAFDASKTTFLLTSGYFENTIFFGWGPQRMEDGSLAVVFPTDDVKIPFIAVEDIGKCAYGIFKAGSEYLGQTVGVAGEHLSGAEFAAALSDALGQPVAFQAVPPDVYRGFDFPGADDVGNMFQFKRDFANVYQGHRDLARARKLNPELMTFRAWLAQNASRIPVPD